MRNASFSVCPLAIARWYGGDTDQGEGTPIAVKTNCFMGICLIVGCSMLACQKSDVVIEQTVWNLKPCSCDSSIKADPVERKDCKVLLSDTFVMRNVSGTLKSLGRIQSDSTVWNYKVDETRFPRWKSYKLELLFCNLPPELSKYINQKVKFDCIIYYAPPASKNGSVGDYGGYVIDLLRIEILK